MACLRRPFTYSCLVVLLGLGATATARSEGSLEIRRVLTRAALESNDPKAAEAVQGLLDGGVAESIAERALRGGNEFLAAELLPHNVGAYVNFEDASSGQSFRRTLARRDFHHNGIRLLIHRSRRAGDHDLETYQVGGGIGVRMDFVEIGEDSLTLSPAVQLMSVRPQLGETFTTTPDAIHPATGNRMTWTCRTVAVELLDLEDGSTVPSVALEIRVRDAELGTRLADFRVWYGDNMAIARRRGDFFGTAIDEMAKGSLVLPNQSSR